MVSSPPSNPGALVIDANITIALAAKETGRETKALAEMARYALQSIPDPEAGPIPEARL